MLFSDSYKVIARPSEGIYKEKGSKFLAYAFPVTKEEEIKEHLAFLKKEHVSARHFCYAYILGPGKQQYRSNDDGEPSGTAGKPIYNQLLSFDITNTLIIVVRYFGGTLLGAAGLVNAYKQAALDALQKATFTEKFIQEQYKIECSYELLSFVMKTARDFNAAIVNQNHEISCALTIAIRRNDAENFLEQLKQQYIIGITYLNTI
jgi:uncharacterized YigZ family protein